MQSLLPMETALSLLFLQDLAKTLRLNYLRTSPKSFPFTGIYISSKENLLFKSSLGIFRNKPKLITQAGESTFAVGPRKQRDSSMSYLPITLPL